MVVVGEPKNTGLVGEADGIQEVGEGAFKFIVVGFGGYADYINEAFWTEDGDEPVGFVATSRGIVAEISGHGGLTVQRYRFCGAGDLHVGVFLLHLFDKFLSGGVQGVGASGSVTFEARDAGYYSISESGLPVACIDYATVGSKSDIVVLALSSPVVWIFQRETLQPQRGHACRGWANLDRAWRRWSWAFACGGCARSGFGYEGKSEDFALDGFEFGRIPRAFLRRAADFANFYFHAFDTVIRIGVIGEKFGRGLGFVVGAEFFEEGGHGPWIVTGIVEDLRAHDIRLGFGTSRIFQEHAARGELPGARGKRAGCSAEDAARGTKNSGAECGVLGFGGLVGAVAQGHVGELVSHDRGELGFVIGGFDGASIDENEPAGERKGVDGFVVDAVKFPWIFDAVGVEVIDQAHANFREVGVDFGIVAHGELLAGFAGDLAAEFDVLLSGEGIDAGLELGAIGVG
jgi:hypothetical protein